MYWLVSYTMREKGHQYPIANDVIDEHPADWLATMVEQYKDSGTTLLFSQKISKAQFKKLKGLL